MYPVPESILHLFLLIKMENTFMQNTKIAVFVILEEF